MLLHIYIHTKFMFVRTRVGVLTTYWLVIVSYVTIHIFTYLYTLCVKETLYTHVDDMRNKVHIYACLYEKVYTYIHVVCNRVYMYVVYNMFKANILKEVVITCR